MRLFAVSVFLCKEPATRTPACVSVTVNDKLTLATKGPPSTSAMTSFALLGMGWWRLGLAGSPAC